MKQVRYADGSPSREVEENEDWETTGQEEMNKLYEKCKSAQDNEWAKYTRKRSGIEADNMHNKSILDVRDALVNLRDLIDVCGTALLSSSMQIDKKVAHVLYFYVDSILQDLEQELANQ